MNDVSDDPFQRTIASLMTSREASVRLKDCIAGNFLIGELTIREFLSDATKSGNLLLAVRSLGRKTADELVALVKVAASEAQTADAILVEEPRARQAFRSLINLLSPISFPGDLLAIDMSTRLRNALKGFDEDQRRRSSANGELARSDLGTAVADWPEYRMRLRRQANVGRSTVTELETIIEGIVSKRLELLSGCKMDAAVTMEMLNEERLNPILYQALINHSANAANTAPIELAPLLHGTDTILCLPPLEHIQDKVAKLPERERETITRRFGLDGSVPQTLEQIASQVHVTRERVRQVEAKALGRLRIGANRSAFKSLLEAEGEAVWDYLAYSSDIIMPVDLQGRRHGISPHFLLAVEVCHGRINDWLDAHGQGAFGGWLRARSDLLAVQENTARIASWARNSLDPVPLATASTQAGVHARDFLNAARLRPEIRLFEGYVCLSNLGSQAKRTCRLHSLAVSRGSARPFDVCSLRDAYVAKYSQDAVSPRVILLQLARVPHLFLRLFDSIWISLPSGPDSFAGVIENVPFSRVPMLASSEFEAGSIGDWLHEVLAKNGPSRTVDLRKLAETVFSNGISQSSVGAILLSNPDFVRIAPGVYGLQSAVVAWSEPGSVCPALFSDTQCRYYAISRKSGDPISIYPGWSSAVEMSLCRWASSNASDEIYRSLLAVAEPSEWPTHPDEAAEWQAKKHSHGSYRLSTTDMPRDMRLPPADSFLSSAVYLATTGSIAWTTVNRTSQRRIDSSKAASSLALLVRFGLASPPLHWQDRHRALPKATDAVTAILSDVSRTGTLSWDEGHLYSLGMEPRSIEHTIYPSEAVENMLAGGEVMADSRGMMGSGNSAPDVESLFGSEDWGALFNTA